jgi:alpha-beta hydrolase superfamily lysophospholipase
MAVYAQDQFTDANGTALNAHTPNVGGTWTVHPFAGSSTPPEIQSNKLRATLNDVYQAWYNAAAPATADYSVELDYVYNGAAATFIGPMARAHNGLTSNYAWIHRKSVNAMQMRGVGTQLGSDVAFSPTIGATYKLIIKVTGTSIQGYVQRASDSQWLTSSATWSSTEQAALTATDSAITSAWNGGFWLRESNETTLSTIDNFRVFDALTSPATGTTLSGPSSGTVGTASTNFTVGVSPTGGDITGTVVVTPNDGGAGGTFSPTTVSLTNGSPTGTFTYTPSTTGARTISITDNGGLTDATGVTYTSNAAPATAITMTGPTSGTVGSPSSNFTVGANGAISGTVTVTPSDGGAGGTFSPTSRNISSGTPTGTFTYTPASSGAKTISATNNGGLTNPSTITYTASAAAATAITLTGPTTGVVGSASSVFTVGANGVISGTVVVTPTDSAGGGTFTPSSVSISSGSPTATFTYTAASSGAKTIGTSDNGSLTDPSTITYTATTAAPYTRSNVTEPASGQPCTLLIPTSYNSGTPTDLVIFCHGQNQPEHAPDSETDPKSIATALTGAGFIIAGSAARSNSWGNQNAINDVVQLERYMRANYNIRNVFIWGSSMGGIVGLNVIASNRFDVRGAFFHAPVCSLSALYAGGAGAYAAIIDGAYGITGSGQATYAVLTRGYDPLLRPASAYSHIPMRFYASPSDGTVAKATNADAFAAVLAGWCREASVVAATGGHIDTSHYQPSDTLAFLQACQAAPVAKGRPASTRTVTVTLTSDGTTPRASLTGVKWAWWDQLTPNLSEWPTDRGSSGTTNGSGVMTLSVRSNLPVGGVGWLQVTNSDGTTTQSPVRLAAGGPVQVS